MWCTRRGRTLSCRRRFEPCGAPATATSQQPPSVPESSCTKRRPIVDRRKFAERARRSHPCLLLPSSLVVISAQVRPRDRLQAARCVLTAAISCKIGSTQNRACNALCARRGCHLRNALDRRIKAASKSKAAAMECGPPMDIEELAADGKRFRKRHGKCC